VVRVRWFALPLLLAAAGLASFPGVGAIGPAQPPPLSVTATASPLSAPVPSTVAFEARAASGSTPYYYNWSFGDGSPNATTQFVNHTFRTIGSFRVNVTVVDALGEIASDWLMVNVTPDPIGISLTAVPPDLAAGTTTYLETSVQGGVPPYRYTWSGLPDGCPPQPVENLSCTPLYGGSFVIHVNVTDARNATGSATTAIVVSGPPPPGSGHPAAASPDYTDDIVAVLIVGAVLVSAAALVGRRARRRRSDPGR
jgi:PKD repeat protein